MTRLARDVYLKSGRRAGDAVLTAGKGGGDEEEAGSRGKRREMRQIQLETLRGRARYFDIAERIGLRSR